LPFELTSIERIASSLSVVCTSHLNSGAVPMHSAVAMTWPLPSLSFTMSAATAFGLLYLPMSLVVLLVAVVWVTMNDDENAAEVDQPADERDEATGEQCRNGVSDVPSDTPARRGGALARKDCAAHVRGPVRPC